MRRTKVRGTLARIATAATLGAGGLLCGLLMLEVVFRVAGAALAPARPARVPRDRPVVLCVGDSHTRGNDQESYPHALEAALAREGIPVRVLNLGIPGQNTAQIRHRLARYLDYYHPDLVLHWAGINNKWNRSERGGRWVARLIQHSRVYRFLSVWRFNRHLLPAFEDPRILKARWKPGHGSRWKVNFGGRAETLIVTPGPGVADARVESITRADLEAMVAMARARGIPFLMLTYPLEVGHAVESGPLARMLVYDAVNSAVAATSAATGTPTIRTRLALEELQRRQPGIRVVDRTGHPSSALYRAIGEQVAHVLRDGGYLRRPSPAPGAPRAAAGTRGP